MIPKHIRVTATPAGGLKGPDSLGPDYPGNCRAVSSVLSLVGDKWSVLIIVVLGNGPLRFNEIKRLIGNISQRMLTLTLRDLEREGLVKRTQFPTIPPRVEYELAPLGRSLRDVVEPLGAWAHAHIDDLRLAREHFDRRNDRP